MPPSDVYVFKCPENIRNFLNTLSKDFISIDLYYIHNERIVCLRLCVNFFVFKYTSMKSYQVLNFGIHINFQVIGI